MVAGPDAAPPAPAPGSPERVRVAIIGAGFAGLAMAARLDRVGIRDWLILERADDVGGTWRDNRYPGAACDIRSDLYSLSFAPEPRWRHRYGRQPEILAYLRSVVRRERLGDRIRLGCAVERADWDDGARVWRVETSRGRVDADVLVSAAGPLVEPIWPDLPGLDDFAGPRVHTARWRDDTGLAGRVAVIGTGASAVQVVPELARTSGSVTVFQRTPPWVVPRGDRPTSALRRRVFAGVPVLQRISRAVAFARAESRWAGLRLRPVGAVFRLVALGHLGRQVADPVLRRRLTPSYRIGCKRILVSDDWYPALQRPGVRLVTSPIVRVEEDAIVTADGERHPVDAIVAGTGFDATHPPVARVLHGRGGRRLVDAWSERMTALRGTAVPGFPNLFLLIGPNTALGHNSMVHIIESQVAYVLSALRAGDGRVVEARVPALESWTARIDAGMRGSVWTAGGCSSFYLDERGRNTTLWPGTAIGFRRATTRFDAREYEVG